MYYSINKKIKLRVKKKIKNNEKNKEYVEYKKKRALVREREDRGQ